MDEVQVHVIHIQALQRGGDALFHTLVPWVVELGGDPDLFARHARVLDALADFVLVAISERSVNVPVAGLQGGADGLPNFVGLGLPGSEADSGDFVALGELSVGFAEPRKPLGAYRVELEGLLRPLEIGGHLVLIC